MKIKHIITTLCLAASLGLGVGIGLKANNNVKAAKADGTIKVYLDLGGSNSYWTGKLSDNNGSKSINVEWSGSATPSGGVSAQKMTKNSFGLYTYDVPSDATKISFNAAGWGGDCASQEYDFDSSKTLWTITSSYTDNTNQTASNQAYSTKTLYMFDKTNMLKKER